MTRTRKQGGRLLVAGAFMTVAVSGCGHAISQGGRAPLASAAPSTICRVIPAPAPHLTASSQYLGYAAGSATSPSNIWLVGSHTGTSGREVSLARRWNGRQWINARIPSPDKWSRSDRLVGVAALSSHLAWAVGTSNRPPFLIRWNGVRWSLGPPLPKNTVVDAMTTFKGKSAWIVGSSGHSRSSTAMILSWSGSTWREIKLPFSGQLTAVTAISARKVWVTGERFLPSRASIPIVGQWNGSTWHVLPAAPGLPSAHHSLTVFAALSSVGGNQLWVGGSDNSSNGGSAAPILDTWNGSRWKSMALPQIPNTTVSAIHVGSARNIWVAAMKLPSLVAGAAPRAYLEHWNGTGWQRLRVPGMRRDSDLQGFLPTPGGGLRIFGWTVPTGHMAYGDVVRQPIVDRLACGSHDQ